MRRYRFHLAFAAAFFSIGILIAFNFCRKAETPTSTFQNLFADKPETQNSTDAFPNQNSGERLTCKDKSLQPFWDELKQNERFDNLDEFYRWLDGRKDDSHDCSDFFRIVREADLNGDNEKEIFIEPYGRGFSDAAGNGELYVFQFQNGIYKKILHDEAGLRRKILETKTKGYFDIESRDNDKLGEGSINVYKFDGKKYNLKDCFTRTSMFFRDEELKKLDEPLITRNKCRG